MNTQITQELSTCSGSTVFYKHTTQLSTDINPWLNIKSLKFTQLHLRLPSPDDAEALLHLFTDQRNIKYDKSCDGLDDPEAITDLIKQWRSLTEPLERLNIVVVVDGKVVGTGGLGWIGNRKTDGKRIASAGLMLNPSVRGLGYAYEALCMIIDYGLRVLDLEAVHIACVDANVPFKTLMIGLASLAYTTYLDPISAPTHQRKYATKRHMAEDRSIILLVRSHVQHSPHSALQPNLLCDHINVVGTPIERAMEALAAVGLAGNIVQFIDFTCKLLSQAKYIYHSRSGQAESTHDLESIAQNFRGLSGELAQHRNLPLSGQGSSNHGNESSLRKLAQECQGAANDMLSALQELKATNPESRWSSFRAALASTWKQPRIDALENRLNSYRSELIVQLQVLQDQRGSAFLSLMKELNERSIRSGINMAHQISDLRQEVQDAMKTLSMELANLNAKTMNPPQQKIDLQMRPERAVTYISSLAQSLVESEKYGTKMMVSLSVLRDLTFYQMDARHSKIHGAHPKTFTAVFGQKIVPWLRSPEQLFWISGKPGSGKSTLMKFIVDNVQTQSHLQHLTASQKPIIASYFFWINGTDIQRSQEGLLRSLLYEILRNNWELIEIALPDSWGSFLSLMKLGNDGDYTWNRAELVAAFERLARSGNTASRLCLFIDGLDEFGGDPDNLIDTIRHLQAMNIKTCVASRPWNVFENAYGHDPKRKVYLQDLNRPDIETYVKDKIRNIPEFQSLHIRTADADHIVEEIVSKSQGVFLWVYLVVRSIREGLRNGDQLSLLRKRLAEIPSDLKEFFDHIFQSIEPTYRVSTAHGFQVALQSTQPLSPLMYWFLDEMEDSPNLALSMPVEALSEYEDSQRFKQMTLRINGRYKGLLEFTTHKEYRVTVDFLHRTVKDFLMTTEIRRTFTEWQHPDFDPDLAICKVGLAELKATVTMQVSVNKSAKETVQLAKRGAITAAVRQILSSAKELEKRGQLVSNLYLDELERIGTIAHDHELSTLPESAIQFPWSEIVGDDFTDAAIQYDLLEFVRRRFDTTLAPLPNKSKVYFLCRDKLSKPALRIDRKGPNLRSPTLEMAELIISSGPPMVIDHNIQHALSEILPPNDSAKTMAFMKKACENGYFATFESDSFEPELDSFLQKTVSPAALEEFRQLNLTLQKEFKAQVKPIVRKKIPVPLPPVQPPPKPSKRDWLRRHLF